MALQVQASAEDDAAPSMLRLSVFSPCSFETLAARTGEQPAYLRMETAAPRTATPKRRRRLRRDVTSPLRQIGRRI